MNVAGRWATGHLIAAVCFAVLAGLRMTDDAWGWAAAFALIATAQLWLSWKGSISRGRAVRAPRAANGSRDRVALSAEQRASSVRSWRAVAAAGCLVAVGLLFVQPVLGLVAAAAAMFSLYRMRQLRGQPVADPPTSYDTQKARVE